jgi:hypothetical protein
VLGESKLQQRRINSVKPRAPDSGATNGTGSNIYCPASRLGGGKPADNRLFVGAVLYRYRAGIPWRDLPERFGDWRNCIDPVPSHRR